VLQRVLQCALQCIVLQCAAVCPTYVGVVSQCVAVHVATCCSVLHVRKAIATRQNFWCCVAVQVCVAVHCNTAATQRVVLQCVKFQCVAVHLLCTSEFFVADPDLQASYRVAKTHGNALCLYVVSAKEPYN